MVNASAEDQWDEFIGDAAQVLSANEELHEALPALMEEPFNPAAQDRLRAVLSSEELTRANQAAWRLSTSPIHLLVGDIGIGKRAPRGAK